MRKHKFCGFTLLEILVVLTAVLLLSAFAIPEVANMVRKSKASRAQADLELLKASMLSFRKDVGQLPPGVGTAWNNIPGTEANMRTLNTPLVSNPGGIVGWNGPYLNSPIIIDPWNRAYAGRKNDEALGNGRPLSYLFSAGNDPNYNTADADITVARLISTNGDPFMPPNPAPPAPPDPNHDFGIIILNDGQ
ncbi:MAG: type II secretion system protein GspG [Armatimonadetes bacterium]|nr:type II secretion system protein GspG [Armatimonadota bacterium]